LDLSSRQGEPFVSRADLVDAYISGLNLTEIAIVGAGKQCRLHTGGDLVPGEPVAHRYLFKSSHVDLLLATIGQDGLSGQPAAALAELVVQAAASIGAPYQSPAQIRKGAELAVAEITERVRIANQSGGMKLINKKYRQYRLAQVAKAEEALPYSKFIEPYLMQILRQIAAAGRMVG
jgi:hypothetical protein